MPTTNRPGFVRMALACFQAQTYEPKELVILDDGETVRDLVPRDPCIRYHQLRQGVVLGRKRNLACELARGEIICHWDDDDWSAPERIEQQVETLESTGKEVTGYHSIVFFDVKERCAWDYRGPADSVVGSSLCYLRSFWSRVPFPHISVGEDTFLALQASKRGQLCSLPGLARMVARRHGANTSPLFYDPSVFEELPLDALPTLFLLLE